MVPSLVVYLFSSGPQRVAPSATTLQKGKDDDDADDDDDNDDDDDDDAYEDEDDSLDDEDDAANVGVITGSNQSESQVVCRPCADCCG